MTSRPASIRRRLGDAKRGILRGVAAVSRRHATDGGSQRPVIVAVGNEGERTPVEAYWERHTVPQLTVWSERSSFRQLEKRFEQYPLFREFSGLWGDHRGERLLDYGCGPGNDLVGFAVHTEAERIIGIDVSREALSAAADRLAIHNVDPGRIELIHSPENEVSIPLPDASVDFFQSQGVLHHTTDPDTILSELHRVLKPGGTGRIMVYNRDSVWRHLYVAYELMLSNPAFAGLDLDDAFRRSTDGLDCPISRNYHGEAFVEMCAAAGLDAQYLGGYLSSTELEALRSGLQSALSDERLARVHRDFLGELTFDAEGLPMYRGLYAGIGGSYTVSRVPSGRE